MTIRKQIISALAIGMLLSPAGVFALDNMKYCNAVQGKTGFIRYPLGTIGIWSTASGEMADVMTRVPKIYPCVNSVVVKGAKEDWRDSITGDPSMLAIKYQAGKPSGTTMTAITASPHVSVFKVTFPEGVKSKYLVFDFSKTQVDPWATLNKWTDRTVTRIDSRTLEATVGEAGRSNAFYIIKFSAPCAGWGTVDASGAVKEGVIPASGAAPRLYVRFDAATITVAVAESFTGMDKAKEFLASEFTDFDAVHRKCLAAWNQVLNRVEMEGSENSKRMAYTALYTMYANLIDGSDGSCYAKYYPRPRSLASSDYWQFIGGYQSCCWDNVRATYPFLILAYPDVMTDVINTYLARYQRDGCMDGDICLFTGPLGHHNIRYTPTLIAYAWSSGVQAEYAKIYAGLKDNYNNDAYFPASISTMGHMIQPASGGFACSRTLEFSDGLHSLGLLAKANHDPEAARKYFALSKCYTNLWDSTNKMFRVRNADGSWGIIDNTNWTWNPNPQGLFEGTSKDWMFSVPHDPYGLINLPGQEDFVSSVIRYCTKDAWFNDYQEIYPFLLYYAGAPNEAQKIIRDTWVPMFNEGVMYEGVRPNAPHSGWNDHYTGSSGWLICSMLGLYPIPAPAGQFIISSPSISKAVIHNGRKDITIKAVNNSDNNIYIKSIKVDGRVYPCYMISARRLAQGANIELKMGSDPSRGLGDLYVASSDGFVLDAELISVSHLKCVIESPAGEATTKIHSKTRPVKVIINGQQSGDWNYDEASQALAIQSADKTTIEVLM
jgi:predicted alpha-1,2-mannosidase